MHLKSFLVEEEKIIFKDITFPEYAFTFRLLKLAVSLNVFNISFNFSWGFISYHISEDSFKKIFFIKIELIQDITYVI